MSILVTMLSVWVPAFYVTCALCAAILFLILDNWTIMQDLTVATMLCEGLACERRDLAIQNSKLQKTLKRSQSDYSELSLDTLEIEDLGVWHCPTGDDSKTNKI